MLDLDLDLDRELGGADGRDCRLRQPRAAAVAATVEGAIAASSAGARAREGEDGDEAAVGDEGES